MKKRLCLSAVLFFFIVRLTQAQVGSQCAQTLRSARSTYEQGRLHEVPKILEGCINSGDFTKSEQVEAYKLLTLSYIYLEEPEKADQAMLGLLNTDHFFELNPEVDPAEFQALYRKFRTHSLFRIGIKLGANTTFPNVITNYYVGDAAKGNGKYSLQPGFQAGIVFEKDLFKTLNEKGFVKKLTLAPEIFYVSRATKKTINNQFLQDSAKNLSAASSTATYNQSWLDLHAIVQYYLKNDKVKTIYVGLGPGVSYLLTSTETDITQGQNGSFVVNGPAINNKSSFNSIAYSAIAVVGMRYRVGGIFLLADVRFQYGLKNVVNPATRTNPQSVNNYAIPLDDYKQSNVMVNIGFSYPYFKPKKLIK
jgi:Outer membrane protein beta-barrel domain